MSSISSRPRVAELSVDLIRAANTNAQLRDDAFGPIRAALAAHADGRKIAGGTVGIREMIDAGHLRMVESTLVTTCARASAAAGFGLIETARGVDGSARIIATNGSGRALVSEIRLSKDGAASLATEVVGIADGSCDRILDRFDAALEALGVRPGTPPERRHTWGVPGLEAARDFVRGIPRAAGPPTPPPALLAQDEDTEAAASAPGVVVAGGCRHD